MVSLASNPKPRDASLKRHSVLNEGGEQPVGQDHWDCSRTLRGKRRVTKNSGGRLLVRNKNAVPSCCERDSHRRGSCIVCCLEQTLGSLFSDVIGHVQIRDVSAQTAPWSSVSASMALGLFGQRCQTTNQLCVKLGLNTGGTSGSATLHALFSFSILLFYHMSVSDQGVSRPHTTTSSHSHTPTRLIMKDHGMIVYIHTFLTW